MSQRRGSRVSDAVRLFRAGFSIIVGIALIATWVRWIAIGAVPEWTTRPVRVAFHIGAEMLTAATLLVAGYGLLRSRRWAAGWHIASLGLLLYATIEGTGYYSAAGQPAMVVATAATGIVAFALILVAARR
ncbi:MAG: hypothetical protein KIS96_03885 [Bauldia sp.]|nr:hypothetical protein [Bauldia sp.]